MNDNTSLCIIGGFETFTYSFFRTIQKKLSNAIFINLNNELISKKNVYNMKIFELKKIIDTLRSHRINKILFLGKINRPNLSNFKYDGEIEKYIPSLLTAFKKGDGNILSTVINIFKKKRIWNYFTK